MDSAAIETLLARLRARRGDSTLVEVKRAAGGLPQNMAETVGAFANMPEGGTILLGIDEADGFRVTGVEHPAALEAALVDQARAVVKPVPHISTSVVEVEGEQVVVASIQPLLLTERPALVCVLLICVKLTVTIVCRNTNYALLNSKNSY